MWVPFVVEGTDYKQALSSDSLVARLCSADCKGCKNLANPDMSPHEYDDQHYKHYKDLDMTCCESKMINVESRSSCGWGTKSSGVCAAVLLV